MDEAFEHYSEVLHHKKRIKSSDDSHEQSKSENKSGDGFD